jgi:hypothetical protein
MVKPKSKDVMRSDFDGPDFPIGRRNFTYLGLPLLLTYCSFPSTRTTRQVIKPGGSDSQAIDVQVQSQQSDGRSSVSAEESLDANGGEAGEELETCKQLFSMDRGLPPQPVALFPGKTKFYGLRSQTLMVMELSSGVFDFAPGDKVELLAQVSSSSAPLLAMRVVTPWHLTKKPFLCFDNLNVLSFESLLIKISGKDKTSVWYQLDCRESAFYRKKGVGGEEKPIVDVVGLASLPVDATGTTFSYTDLMPFGGDILNWTSTLGSGATNFRPGAIQKTPSGVVDRPYLVASDGATFAVPSSATPNLNSPGSRVLVENLMGEALSVEAMVTQDNSFVIYKERGPIWLRSFFWVG